jgi:chemotaxis protein methyltransferase CheR
MKVFHMNHFSEPNKFMTKKEQQKISRFIEENFGVKMPESKESLLIGRLMKRLRELKFKTYEEYFDYVLNGDHDGHELHEFTDLVTTHETRFFRESSHFNYLHNKVLPVLYKTGIISPDNPLQILSAASSTGEEAYSIAIIVEEFFKNNSIFNINYSITGFDVSAKAIQTAANAIYNESRTAEIPLGIKHRYFMKSRIKSRKLVKIIPEIRKKVNFTEFNLIDDRYRINGKFHIIFCCNVLIYFDRDNQKKVCMKLINQLYGRGYFFIGKAETLFDFSLPVKSIQPSIYFKG